MLNKSVLAWLFGLVCFCAQLAAQIPTGVVGWYNGDWKPAIPGMSNWYISDQQFSRVFDDFVVPAGGWTVAGVFSHNSMSPNGVTEATWEIRTGVSAGNGGAVVASGIGAATLTQGPLVGNGVYTYLVQVDGLWLPLLPGRYWLSVAPVTALPQTYLCATLGANAIGNPPGNDGGAFFYQPGGANFMPVQTTGQGGTSGDFSLGVLIAPASVSRDTAWQYDLSSLAQQMPSLHSVPFPGVSVADFAGGAAVLSGRVPVSPDAVIRTGLQALVASIGDPHTDVEWPSPSPFEYLPFSFYWFDEGIYVTAAPAEYQELLGGKLIAIGRSGVDDVIRRLTPLVAHDNDSWLKYLLTANRLANTDFLLGTGVTDSAAAAQVLVQAPSGEPGNAYDGVGQAAMLRPVGRPPRLVSVNVAAADPARFPAMLSLAPPTLPLSRQHLDRHYWATVIDGGATVYFQYNSCTEDLVQPSADFLAQLNQMLAQPGVERLILDMRNNTGGSATILDPWIQTIETSRFNQAGRLYVIVGRATFSAAMEAADLLRDGTAAIFVGEPTGGKPQFLLRRGDFALPFFGIRVSYSNGVEHANDPGPTLTPDIQVGVTFQDYVNGVDRALDAILSIPPPRS